MYEIAGDYPAPDFFGINSENVDDFLDSEDPNIRLFLGLEGNLGESLGLENDFTVKLPLIQIYS